MRELRPYQQEAVSAVVDAWESGTLRPSVVLATGLGKSTVIASLANEAVSLGLRVVLLAHRGELLQQMADTVALVNPALEPVGIVRAEQDDHHAPIVAASFQTIQRGHRRAALGPRQVILCDEAHHAVADSYREVLTELGAFDGSAVACGFTATMRRLDERALGEVWQDVVYERDLQWAIRHKYLVPPHGLTVALPGLDLSKVRTVAGDYHQGQLAEAMTAASDAVVSAILTHAPQRTSIVFVASVQAAQYLAVELQSVGVPAAYVVGSMPFPVREPIYQDFREGRIRVLVTVQVLTEGADFPMCDAVVMARPTKSQVLYSQMVGRALRPYPGKDSALVLDIAGHTRTLDLVTLTCLFPQARVRVVDPYGQEVRQEVAQERAPRQLREGPQEFVPIDLLGRTEAVWLKTPAGVTFTQSGDYAVFLWPPGGQQVGVGVVSVRGPKKGGWVTQAPLEVGEAMEVGEAYAHDNLAGIVRRGQSWRSTAAPSEAQIRWATTLGVANPHTMTRARLSDEISIALAAKRLDPAVRPN